MRKDQSGTEYEVDWAFRSPALSLTDRLVSDLQRPDED